MPQILIAADDYTGANDTAVLMTGIGFSTYTVLEEDMNSIPDAQCIAISTDSRACPEEEAYRRVYEVTAKLRGGDTFLLSKRIDSTLRGNLGAEIDAMLDGAGDERCALVVPTFPGAGRVYKNRCLYVNGVPLDQTAAARDPKNPIRTSSALDILQKQSRYPVGEITLAMLGLSPGELAAEMKQLRRSGVRLILCEAETQADLQTLAEAAILMEEPFICSDPGAFTCAVARCFRQGQVHGTLFFLIGSVNAVTAAQVRRLEKEADTGMIYLDARSLLEEDSEASQKRLLEDLRHQRDEMLKTLEGRRARTMVLCTSGIFEENKIDFSEYEKSTALSREELSDRLNARMADLAARLILEQENIRGLFACGGDTAVALCHSLGAKGEYPLEEVIPLAVYGKLAGGRMNQVPIITKGGMIGGEDTLVRCRDFLYRVLEKETEQ